MRVSRAQTLYSARTRAAEPMIAHALHDEHGGMGMPPRTAVPASVFSGHGQVRRCSVARRTHSRRLSDAIIRSPDDRSAGPANRGRQRQTHNESHRSHHRIPMHCIDFCGVIARRLFGCRRRILIQNAMSLARSVAHWHSCGGAESNSRDTTPRRTRPCAPARAGRGGARGSMVCVPRRRAAGGSIWDL